jgi:hypothetical protein
MLFFQVNIHAGPRDSARQYGNANAAQYQEIIQRAK